MLWVIINGIRHDLRKDIFTEMVEFDCGRFVGYQLGCMMQHQSKEQMRYPCSLLVTWLGHQAESPDHTYPQAKCPVITVDMTEDWGVELKRLIESHKTLDWHFMIDLEKSTLIFRDHVSKDEIADLVTRVHKLLEANNQFWGKRYITPPCTKFIFGLHWFHYPLWDRA